MNYFLLAFQKFGQFSGRARRREYGYFVVVNVAITIMLAFIDAALSQGSSSFGTFTSIFSLVTFIPSLTLTVRRLHDLNISAWGLLLFFVPIVGFVYALFLFFKKGTEGANKFGEPSMA